MKPKRSERALPLRAYCAVALVLFCRSASGDEIVLVPPSGAAASLAGPVLPKPEPKDSVAEKPVEKLPVPAGPMLLPTVEPAPAVVLGLPSITAPADAGPVPFAPLAHQEPERPPPQPKIAPKRPTPDELGEDQPILLVTITVEPPGPASLFRLETEEAWRERMRQDAQRKNPLNRLEFPERIEPKPLENTIKRIWPHLTELTEPNYVCYRRLFFEDINVERYGWSLGVIQPYASVVSFYWNLGLLPIRLLMTPLRNYECNAGYWLPGDPAPYLLYPPAP